MFHCCSLTCTYTQIVRARTNACMHTCNHALVPGTCSADGPARGSCCQSRWPDQGGLNRHGRALWQGPACDGYALRELRHQRAAGASPAPAAAMLADDGGGCAAADAAAADDDHDVGRPIKGDAPSAASRLLPMSCAAQRDALLRAATGADAEPASMEPVTLPPAPPVLSTQAAKLIMEACYA